MNSIIKYHKTLCLVVCSIMLLSSCEKDEEDSQTEDSPELNIAENAEFGNVLVDQEGRTLYFSANDISGESTCIGGCESVWPPFIADLFKLEIKEGLNSNDINFITREDGTKQITYKGWPLYYFSPDGDGILEESGEVTGDGRGDVFYVAKHDYNLFLGKQAVEEGEDPVVYIVDNNGVSLYLNTGDEDGLSNCTGGCADVWPPFVTAASLVLPSLLDENQFSVVYRDDEFGPQLAFLGSPLYHFASDELKRGNVFGQGGGPAQSFFVVDPR